MRSCSSCGQQARSHRLENPGCGRVLSETKHLCATEFASSAISAVLSWNDSVKRFANPTTFISECPRKTLHLGFCRDFARHCKARCLYVLYVCMHACMHVCMYALMYCMYVCMHACMHVCMVPSSVSPPPPWVGSPGSTPLSLLFASYWQHF